jgi:uncharacterized protein YegP (UPF0339 family)
MTGTFELLVTNRGAFEFRLLSRTGEVLAVSGPYRDRDSALAAILDARECAAVALVNDRTTQPRQPATPTPDGSPHDHRAPSQWFG